MSIDTSPIEAVSHFGGDPDWWYTSVSREFAEWEKVETQARIILEATPHQLDDPLWLADRIRNAGLFPFKHGEDTYDSDHTFMNETIQGVNQLPLELAQYWTILKDLEVRTHLEIGALSGSTGTLTAAYLQRAADIRRDAMPLTRVILLDVEPHFFFYEHVKSWLPIDYVIGNSFHFAQERHGFVDSVLIDGDHVGRWVLADWQNAGCKAARVCAFHDIVSQSYSGRRYGGPPGIWQHVKVVTSTARSQFIEVIHHPKRDRWGLGLRINP